MSKQFEARFSTIKSKAAGLEAAAIGPFLQKVLAALEAELAAHPEIAAAVLAQIEKLLGITPTT